MGILIGSKVCYLHEVLSYVEPFLSGAKRQDASLSARNSGTLSADLLRMIDHWQKESKHTSSNPSDYSFLQDRDFTYLPPIHPVTSFRDFYAFEQHVKTARAARGLEMVPQWYDFPVFYFSNAQSIVAHEEEISAPTHGKWLDYELEIGAVIGSECRDVPAEKARSVIAGYTIINDWSLRDLQREEVKVGLGPAKGKDFATSMGPFLVTPDEIDDRQSGKGFNLQMVARVNGVELSRGNWKDIHYSFGEMIERASRGVTLYPGEVIGSGTVGTGCILELTPEKVAAKLGRENGWLQSGDVVELEVERLGVLTNTITERA